MNTINRWLILFFIVFLTISLVYKGVELWSLGTNLDGDGIGIHFLGVEINDRVPEANIPIYAIGFFSASIITSLIAIALFLKSFLKIKSKTIAS
ncbi:hypothetical protein JOC85_001834 [Bacillus mesophilus]|uniref:DUF4306 domain-containing protein n=1 Tax=Bacillus mesophilus TaxID=1808955 RepID=A0A6M0Q586_9BACI|nr:hypothetical protein [Bacillus mesophilus]MBM7661062.1 hypothetical protein [Bacillus mesophilus]NEY71403.1 hypothetical protein [Bacillus mesophilus]